MHNHLVKKNKAFCLLFTLLVTLIFTSCRTLLFPQPKPSQASTMRVSDPNLSNEEYVMRLLADNWPADSLNTALNADYLDDDEKNIILAHNLVRYDPARFARLYVNEYIGYFKGNEFHYPDITTILITREGVEPALELYTELMRTRPMGLLYPSEGLSMAAQSHVNYLCERGIRGHGGQGGMRRRIERFGEWTDRIAENISYGSFSAHDAVLYLLIDDQVHNRSHRRIILDPKLHLAGTAKNKHPAYPTGYTYVINYSAGFTKHSE